MSRIEKLECDVCFSSQERVRSFGRSDLCDECLKEHEIYKAAVKETSEELLEEVTEDLIMIRPKVISNINDYCNSVEILRKKYRVKLEKLESKV